MIEKFEIECPMCRGRRGRYVYNAELKTDYYFERCPECIGIGKVFLDLDEDIIIEEIFNLDDGLDFKWNTEED